MKKSTLLAFVTLAAFTLSFILLEPSQAQVGKYRPQLQDVQLASTIKRLANRSFEGLVERPARHGGGIDMDLQGRFQDVPMAKLDVDGDPMVGCVASLEEANTFLGRDLETGEVLAGTDDAEYLATKRAAQHDMSQQEYKFYKGLINNAVSGPLEINSSTFVVDKSQDGPEEGFNDPLVVVPEGGNAGTTRGEQRMILFKHAAAIWGSFLDSKVPITINAKFDPLTPCSSTGGVLGQAGAATISRDFTGAEFPQTWYPVALRNKVMGADGNTANAEINATFNSDVDTGCLGSGSRFYYGLDGAAVPQRVNLLVVLLHELGHGLGFQSYTNGQTGVANGGFTDMFARRAFDPTAVLFWNQMTDAQRAASGISSNLYWNGPNVNAASTSLTSGRDTTSGRVKLYAPATYESGSSISHYDKSAFPNLLMEPVITAGLPLNLDLTRQHMRDIGWYRDQNNDGVADSITTVAASATLLATGGPGIVTWVNSPGFNKNVTVEMSTDGGENFSTAIATDVPNTGILTFTVPNVSTSNARFRVREAGFQSPAGSSLVNITVTGGTATPTPTPTATPTPTPTATPTPTPTPAAEIVVEHPVGTGLVDNVSTINFGSALPGIPTATKQFTIRNAGVGNLTIGLISVNGTSSFDFAVNITGMNTVVAAGGSTTFNVTFTPSGTGARTAVIRVANNDSNENPFDINVTGTGSAPTPTPTPTATPTPTPTPTPTATPIPPNTQVGANVSVASVTGDVNVTFSQVSSPGTTAFAAIDPAMAGTAPLDYTPAGPAYEIVTTATFTPPITMCFVLNSITDPAEFARVRVLHGEGGQLVDRTIMTPGDQAPNFETRSVCALVDSLSPFVAAMAPPAAYQVSGRVLTPDGRGLRNAVVSLTDSKGERRSIASSSLGFFSFDGILPGEIVSISVSSKRYRFASQMLQANDSVTSLDLFGQE